MKVRNLYLLLFIVFSLISFGQGTETDFSYLDSALPKRGVEDILLDI